MLSVQRLLTGTFCVCTNTWMCICGAREQPQMSFFKAYTPCSVRQSLTCFERSKQARLLAREPRIPPVSVSQCWAYTRVLQCLAVLCGFWIANRGPHTCATSALLGEPSPKGLLVWGQVTTWAALRHYSRNLSYLATAWSQ